MNCYNLNNLHDDLRLGHLLLIPLLPPPPPPTTIPNLCQCLPMPIQARAEAHWAGQYCSPLRYMAACLVFGQLTAWPGAWSIQPRRRVNVDVVIKHLKKISHLLNGGWAVGVTSPPPLTSPCNNSESISNV